MHLARDQLCTSGSVVQSCISPPALPNWQRNLLINVIEALFSDDPVRYPTVHSPPLMESQETVTDLEMAGAQKSPAV